MQDESGAAVSNRAWIELLHGEVCWVLADAGADALVIKGPSIAQWLYPEGGRESVDVDLLVRPAHWDRAVAVLVARGFAETWVGRREGEVSDHSLDLQRTDPELGQHGVDLHSYFPGIDLAPSAAFELLWERRLPASQAGVDVSFPDLPSRALITALHAARDPLSPKVAEDLRRAMAALDDAQRDDLKVLAAELQARGALRAGLETQPATADLVELLGLDDAEVSTYWELRSHGAGRTAVRLDQLREMPWRHRPGQIGRWLFPSPALMRTRDQRAAEGTVGLGVAYASRLGEGLRALPSAVRDLRAARRPPMV
jgi:hypothetical protein